VTTAQAVSLRSKPIQIKVADLRRAAPAISTHRSYGKITCLKTEQMWRFGRSLVVLNQRIALKYDENSKVVVNKGHEIDRARVF
jgi:hypothetical protein